MNPYIKILSPDRSEPYELELYQWEPREKCTTDPRWILLDSKLTIDFFKANGLEEVTKYPGYIRKTDYMGLYTR